MVCALLHDATLWDDTYLPDSGADLNENSHRDVLVARELIFASGMADSCSRDAAKPSRWPGSN
jgi:hypothetical protein